MCYQIFTEVVLYWFFFCNPVSSIVPTANVFPPLHNLVTCPTTPSSPCRPIKDFKDFLSVLFHLCKTLMISLPWFGEVLKWKVTIIFHIQRRAKRIPPWLWVKDSYPYIIDVGCFIQGQSVTGDDFSDIQCSTFDYYIQGTICHRWCYLQHMQYEDFSCFSLFEAYNELKWKYYVFYSAQRPKI